MSRPVIELPVDGGLCFFVPDRTLPVVRVTVATPFGSAYDPRGKAGLTTCTTEMLTRGTQTLDRHQFGLGLEQVASPLDTSTGSAMSRVLGEWLNRHHDAAVDFMQQALNDPSFTDHEREQYVREAQASLASVTDSDAGLARFFLRKSLYRNHPFGREALGQMPDLEQLSRHDLSAHHQGTFQRNRYIGICGDLTDEQAVELCNGLAPPNSGPVELSLPPPVKDLTRGMITIIDKPDRSQNQLWMAQPGPAGTDPQSLAFSMGVLAFGGTFSSPLCQEVRDKRGWSYDVGATYGRQLPFRSPVVMYAAPGKDDGVSCLKLMLSMHRQLSQQGISRSDFERARDYVLNQHPFVLADASSLLSSTLDFALIGKGSDYIYEYTDEVEALNFDQVNDALTTNLKADKLAVAMVAEATDVETEVRKTFEAYEVEVIDHADLHA